MGDTMRVTLEGTIKREGFRAVETAVLGPNDELIAVCYFGATKQPAYEHARLFAAAKDLLEALRPFAHLAKVLDEGHMLNYRGVYIGDQDARAAVAAIAQAEGKEA